MLKRFYYAFSGIVVALKEQSNLRFHLLASIVVSGCAFFFNVTKTEWYVLLLCIMMVWAMELMNTAIEYTVDLYTTELHPLAKKAKDVAAAAVLVSAIIAAVIGGTIFGNYIFNYFFTK